MISNCFVIMGFNIKSSKNGKEYNLNLSYENIIKPVLDEYNLEYTRADEIMMAEIIDDSMYRLLLCADLVIADITTLNPNAIYELGVRYALKPHSTIIIASNDTTLPFDLAHIRVFTYDHKGSTIEHDVCNEMISTLKKVISNITRHISPEIDSPVYKFLGDLKPPEYVEKTNYFTKTIQRFKSENSLGNLIHEAYSQREAGNFVKAKETYKEALKISKDEYVIKEIAVCTYQEGTHSSFLEALEFIKANVDITQTLNPEILKTLGTIYKNLWLLQNEKITNYAEKALDYYEKSFILLNTYNSGLNYGFMLLVLSSVNEGEDRIKYYNWSKHIYSKVKNICMNKYDIEDYWVNVSISECCLVLDEIHDSKKYFNAGKCCLNLNKPNMIWKLNKTRTQLQNIVKLKRIIKSRKLVKLKDIIRLHKH